MRGTCWTPVIGVVIVLVIGVTTKNIPNQEPEIRYQEDDEKMWLEDYERLSEVRKC